MSFLLIFLQRMTILLSFSTHYINFTYYSLDLQIHVDTILHINNIIITIMAIIPLVYLIKIYLPKNPPVKLQNFPNCVYHFFAAVIKFIWTNCLVILPNFPNHHYRYYFNNIENKNCVTVLNIYEGISGLHFTLLKKRCSMQFRKKTIPLCVFFTRLSFQRARIFTILILRKKSAK